MGGRDLVSTGCFGCGVGLMWSGDWYLAGQTLQPVDEVKRVSGAVRCYVVLPLNAFVSKYAGHAGQVAQGRSRHTVRTDSVSSSER